MVVSLRVVSRVAREVPFVRPPLAGAPFGVLFRLSAMQRRKGANGEREIARILRAHGFSGQRTALLQTHGVAGAADVTGLPGIHIEVKRAEALRIEQWCRQAEAECGEKVPVVMWRRSRQPWRVTLPLADFLDMQRRLNGGGDTDARP